MPAFPKTRTWHCAITDHSRKQDVDMPRPKRKRRICNEPDYVRFSPDGISPSGQVTLTLDEYEAIRLVDLEGRTHQEAAQQMQVSRTTLTEIYESARHKMAECLVEGKRMEVSGGSYRICSDRGCCPKRHHAEGSRNLAGAPQKGEMAMRIAVTYEDGNVYQHFGHTEAFKVYDVVDGKVISSEVVGTNGYGHGALAGYLASGGVDVLICGGIGGGAQMALQEYGIELYGGITGSADEAVQALIEGKLEYDPNPECNHGDHVSQACGHGHETGRGHGGCCEDAQEPEDDGCCCGEQA